MECSTKDMPGGDACQLIRGHQGPHDWEGGRPANERHATDFVGRSLYLLDAVAITHQRGGKGSKWVLVRAVVTNITPQGVRVVTDDEGEELWREECQVMKVRQP